MKIQVLGLFLVALTLNHHVDGLEIPKSYLRHRHLPQESIPVCHILNHDPPVVKDQQSATLFYEGSCEANEERICGTCQGLVETQGNKLTCADYSYEILQEGSDPITVAPFVTGLTAADLYAWSGDSSNPNYGDYNGEEYVQVVADTTTTFLHREDECTDSLFIVHNMADPGRTGRTGSCTMTITGADFANNHEVFDDTGLGSDSISYDSGVTTAHWAWDPWHTDGMAAHLNLGFDECISIEFTARSGLDDGWVFKADEDSTALDPEVPLQICKRRPSAGLRRHRELGPGSFPVCHILNTDPVTVQDQQSGTLFYEGTCEENADRICGHCVDLVDAQGNTLTCGESYYYELLQESLTSSVTAHPIPTTQTAADLYAWSGDSSNPNYGDYNGDGTVEAQAETTTMFLQQDPNCEVALFIVHNKNEEGLAGSCTMTIKGADFSNPQVFDDTGLGSDSIVYDGNSDTTTAVWAWSPLHTDGLAAYLNLGVNECIDIEFTGTPTSSGLSGGWKFILGPGGATDVGTDRQGLSMDDTLRLCKRLQA